MIKFIVGESFLSEAVDSFLLNTERFTFPRCSVFDKSITNEVQHSLEELNGNNSFSFFNLFLTSSEKEHLSKFYSAKFQDEEIGSIAVGSDNKQLFFSEFKTHQTLKKLGDIDFDKDGYYTISKLIVRLASIISDSVDGDIDLHIRTTPNINQDCIFWHIDRDPLIDSDQEKLVKRFVIPLIGNGTFYQEINATTREQFFKYSSSLPGYWGHDYGGCTGKDPISQMLSQNSFQITQSGHGSVHYLGRNAAMHAEPDLSDSRLVLIINEIKR